jgi:hypothetical protein
MDPFTRRQLIPFNRKTYVSVCQPTRIAIYANTHRLDEGGHHWKLMIDQHLPRLRWQSSTTDNWAIRPDYTPFIVKKRKGDIVMFKAVADKVQKQRQLRAFAFLPFLR